MKCFNMPFTQSEGVRGMAAMTCPPPPEIRSPLDDLAANLESVPHTGCCPISLSHRFMFGAIVRNLLLCIATLLAGSMAAAQVIPLRTDQAEVVAGSGQLAVDVKRVSNHREAPQSSSNSRTAKIQSAGQERNTKKSPGAVTGDVVLYGASWCPYCRQARAYLREHDIEYTVGSSSKCNTCVNQQGVAEDGTELHEFEFA
jgi:thiol-disulfide isomerase/thioredoxin